MPIHLIWGDDQAAIERTLNKLIKQIIDPSWGTINISQLNGSDITSANQALEEVRTPPFGSGGRVVLLKNSPFCNGCSNELAVRFEKTLELIPENSHLILCNSNKPDGRLKTTKVIQKLIKEKKAIESHYLLPAIWDERGQKQLIERTAQDLGLNIDEEAITAPDNEIASVFTNI